MGASVQRFVFWTPNHRARLNAYRLLKAVRPDMRRIDALAAGITHAQALSVFLHNRREGIERKLGRGYRRLGSCRFSEEALIVAFEARRAALGLPKLPERTHYDLRRQGLGLDVEGKAFHLFEQVAARYFAWSAERVPTAARLYIAGPDTETVAGILDGAAALMADEAVYLRGRRRFPSESHPHLREELVGEWARAAGLVREDDLGQLDRMLAHARNARLQARPMRLYRDLSTVEVERARAIAGAVAGDDDPVVVAFYIFRMMQRLAAFARDGVAPWRAEWLRGTRADPDAIPGAGGKERPLRRALREHLGDEVRGHSGTEGHATLYRLRHPLADGDVGHHEAARLLGLRLNAKGFPVSPRRGGKP